MLSLVNKIFKKKSKKPKSKEPERKPAISKDAVVLISFGCLNTKYGLIDSPSPDSMLSLFTKSRHCGVGEEVIGNDVLKMDNYDYIQTELFKETNTYGIGAPHLAMQALINLNFPDREYPETVGGFPLQPIAYIDDDKDLLEYIKSYLEPNTITTLEPKNCITAGVNFSDCIVVDLGHKIIRFYIIHNKTIIATEQSVYGGEQLSQFFVQLILENNKQFQSKFDCAFAVALDGIGCIATSNKEYEQEGYRNITDDINLLHKDSESLFSLLPQELVSTVIKYRMYENMKLTVLAKLGWFPVAEKQPVQVQLGKFLTMTYGVEKYLAMEALFQPRIMSVSSPGLADCLSSLIKKNAETLGKTPEIVLTGGMTRCPGLVERLQKELTGVKFNITVDEHLLWKGACNLLKQ